jgi:probable LLM family oxidoreductase
MQIGISTFVELVPDARTGEQVSPRQRMQDLVEEVVLADEVGLDVVGIGEHHRPDFLSSSPATVLAGLATRTRQVQLTSAVTVLSSDDPVRVFQQFATLDLLSDGRAEIMAGRGAFIESFPLFGYDLADYDALFDEKLDLLLTLRSHEKVTWRGRHRPPLTDLGVYPRPVRNPLPVWLAVGGTPESVLRAGRLGLPMMLGIIGGPWARFAPLAQVHRQAATEAGHPVPALGINSHLHVAKTSQQAREQFYPYYASYLTTMLRGRGLSSLGQSDFAALVSPEGAAFAGSPSEITDKILAQYELFGHQRFLAQVGVGTMPHEMVMQAIELLGTSVLPAVRAATGKTPSAD